MSRITVKKIVSQLETIFPQEIAEEWDKVGLQMGSNNKTVKNVLVSLDLTSEVFNEAVDKQVDLIIIHHPFLFYEDDFMKIPKERWKADLIERINNLGMAVYVMHTNFDNEPKGMTLAIWKKLKLTKGVMPIEGLTHGFIFKWSQTLSSLESHFNRTLGIEIKNTTLKQDTIFDSIAIIPGSGSVEDVIKASKSKVDLIITSDIKWSDWTTFKEYDIPILEISHGIEDAFTQHIYTFLKKTTKEIRVFKKELN